jgi:hypothetical protein
VESRPEPADEQCYLRLRWTVKGRRRAGTPSIRVDGRGNGHATGPPIERPAEARSSDLGDAHPCLGPNDLRLFTAEGLTFFPAVDQDSA